MTIELSAEEIMIIQSALYCYLDNELSDSYVDQTYKLKEKLEVLKCN